MGHGIVQTSAAAGFQVVAVDNDDAAVGRGMGMIKKSLDTLAAKAASPEEGAKKTAEVLGRIKSTTKRGDLADCDLIIEAVPETMEIKTPVYKDFGALADLQRGRWRRRLLASCGQSQWPADAVERV